MPKLTHKIIILVNVNPWRWGGRYYDAESGLYAVYDGLMTRYYDPRLGVVINAALDEAMTTGVYAHGITNPLEVFGHTFAQPTWGYPKVYIPDPADYEAENQSALFRWINNLPPWVGWIGTGIVAVGSIALIIGGIKLIPFGIGVPMIMAGVGGLMGLGFSAATQAISGEGINPNQLVFNGTIGMATGFIGGHKAIGPLATFASVSSIGFVGNVGNDMFNSGGDWNQVRWGRAVGLGLLGGAIVGGGKLFSTAIPSLAKRSVSKLPQTGVLDRAVDQLVLSITTDMWHVGAFTVKKIIDILLKLLK